eukprot:403375653
MQSSLTSTDLDPKLSFVFDYLDQFYTDKQKQQNKVHPTQTSSLELEKYNKFLKQQKNYENIQLLQQNLGSQLLYKGFSKIMPPSYVQLQKEIQELQQYKEYQNSIGSQSIRNRRQSVPAEYQDLQQKENRNLNDTFLTQNPLKFSKLDQAHIIPNLPQPATLTNHRNSITESLLQLQTDEIKLFKNPYEQIYYKHSDRYNQRQLDSSDPHHYINKFNLISAINTRGGQTLQPNTDNVNTLIQNSRELKARKKKQREKIISQAQSVNHEKEYINNQESNINVMKQADEFNKEVMQQKSQNQTQKNKAKQNYKTIDQLPELSQSINFQTLNQNISSAYLINEFKKQQTQNYPSLHQKYLIHNNDKVINKTRKNFWAQINHSPGFPRLNHKLLVLKNPQQVLVDIRRNSYLNKSVEINRNRTKKLVQ